MGPLAPSPFPIGMKVTTGRQSISPSEQKFRGRLQWHQVSGSSAHKLSHAPYSPFTLYSMSVLRTDLWILSPNQPSLENKPHLLEIKEKREETRKYLKPRQSQRGCTEEGGTRFGVTPSAHLHRAPPPPGMHTRTSHQAGLLQTWHEGWRLWRAEGPDFTSAGTMLLLNFSFCLFCHGVPSGLLKCGYNVYSAVIVSFSGG